MTSCPDTTDNRSSNRIVYYYYLKFEGKGKWLAAFERRIKAKFSKNIILYIKKIFKKYTLCLLRVEVGVEALR